MPIVMVVLGRNILHEASHPFIHFNSQTVGHVKVAFCRSTLQEHVYQQKDGGKHIQNAISQEEFVIKFKGTVGQEKSSQNVR